LFFLFVLKEGPHSSLKEEEFFDALDQSLDRIDRESDKYQRLVSIDCFFLVCIKIKMSNKDIVYKYVGVTNMTNVFCSFISVYTR
jgi:hypothetical protein